LASISDADAILVFGPGEAKSELKKRLDRAKFGGHITIMETTDKLTDRQNRGQSAQSTSTRRIQCGRATALPPP